MLVETSFSGNTQFYAGITENLTTKTQNESQMNADNGGGNLIAAKRPAVDRQTPDYGGQAAKSTKKGINLTQRRKG